MPPKFKKKDCLIILLNVGCNDDKENENDKSFLEKSKLITKLLIQRKIFLRPKDEVGVIIMGASETKNRMSCDNMVEMNSLQLPTWDLVENVMNLQGTQNSCNWIDGIYLVLDYIRTECVDQNVSRTVVLLTDFKEDRDVLEQYDMDTIADDIKAAEINLLTIGTKSLNGDSQIEFNPSEELFAKVCKRVEGETMLFDDTIARLMIYKDQPKNPMPWKIDMDLFDIEIPVVVYLKTTEDFKLPKWQLFSNTETGKVPVVRNRAIVDKMKNEIGRNDIITGNMYGRKFIPFSDEDKAALKYQSGPKGFTIYGFTKRQHIKMDCLAGKGAYIVVPAQQYASPFYSLVKAMADSNKVAIVRRVYRANTAPKMGVLFPQIDIPGNPWCLVYIELVFPEDKRIVQVKPIKSTMDNLSADQEEAIDNLIDSMMLMEVENESTNEKKEAFQAGGVSDVSRQHVWDKLTHRALYPDQPLPPMSDFLKKLLEPPKSVQQKSEPVLKLISRLFPVKSVQKKQNVKKRPADNSNDLNADDPDIKPLRLDPSLLREELDVEDFSQDMGTENEELSQNAELVEAVPPPMDVNLAELAMDM